MFAGFVVVAYLSGLDIDLVKLVNAESKMAHPAWVPVIEFPWRIMFGTVVTFVISMCGSTSETVMAQNRLK
jgi:hypothetical protein